MPNIRMTDSFIETLLRPTLTRPTAWEDDVTPLDAEHLGANSNAIGELNVAVLAAYEKINEIITEGVGSAVEIVFWPESEG